MDNVEDFCVCHNYTQRYLTLPPSSSSSSTTAAAAAVAATTTTAAAAAANEYVTFKIDPHNSKKKTSKTDRK